MMHTKDALQNLINVIRESIDNQAITAVDKGRLRSRLTDFESEMASIRWGE